MFPARMVPPKLPGSVEGGKLHWQRGKRNGIHSMVQDRDSHEILTILGITSGYWSQHGWSRDVARCVGGVYLLPALSSAGASLASPCFRFHIPLIEPDGRISASGPRRKVHEVAHGRWRGRLLRRTRPSTLCGEALEKPLGPRHHFVLGTRHVTRSLVNRLERSGYAVTLQQKAA
jgi:hypothetical protein